MVDFQRPSYVSSADALPVMEKSYHDTTARVATERTRIASELNDWHFGMLIILMWFLRAKVSKNGRYAERGMKA